MSEEGRVKGRIELSSVLFAAGAGAVGAWLWYRNRPKPRDQPDNVGMHGRVCVVTGANTGIGKATATALARQGARVVLGCRSTTKGEAACEDIRRRVPGAEVETLELDLESFDSVRGFVKRFRETGLPLHVLVNNAGIMVKKPEAVQGGMEKTMVVNHLGPFLLTHLLLPELQKSAAGEPSKSSRIVNVASRLEKNGSLPAMEAGVTPGTEWFLPPSGDDYDMWKQYGASKLCNLLFTFELHRRLTVGAQESTSAGDAGAEAKPGGVTANAVTPGVVASDLGRNMMATPWMFRLAKPLLALVMRTVDKGAETVVWAASTPDVEGSGGKFWGDLKETECSERSKDEDVAEKLWEACEIATELGPDERTV